MDASGQSQNEQNHEILNLNHQGYRRVEKNRNKTPLRLKYEAESSVIRRKLGSLDEIRRTLGLSRRKMAQLLMVDPSAWTRWTQHEETIPPHIYRSLQWYLALIEKEPAWHPQNTFNSSSSLKFHEEELKRLQVNFDQQIAYLKKENNRLESELVRRVQSVEEEKSKDRPKSLREMAWKGLALFNLFALLLALLWKSFS
ncbi:MAG: hypothetical protein KDD35_05040 [Bdellovibrionales bacterium]|nr:hypothetical protein [Bdellovibrionales bacterium]